MNRLKLDPEALGLSTILERIAGVQVKDCFKDDTGETIYYVVETGQLGKALGKGGINVKRIQEHFTKRIRIIEYRNEVISFVKNVIYPAQVEEVVQENNEILIKDSSRKTKSLLIGRGGKNLKLINRAVKRFFNINEVKII